MFQLTAGLFIFMYILGVVVEEIGIEPNTRLERQELERKCDRASDEEFILLSCRK
jgi:hypothetical protein